MYIRSKRVFIDNKLRPATIEILSEKITKISSYSSAPKDELLDLNDLIVLPAAIDGHVHMREPEASNKEDFFSGSMAALKGGVSAFIDMPCYNSPPTTTVGALAEKEKLASKKSFCDFGFHFGATETNSELIKKLKPPSIKAFLAETHSPLTLSENGLEKLFLAAYPAYPILVHCEDKDIIEKNKKIYKEHHKIRSIQAAIEAVKKVNKLATKYKRRVHFCHLSTSKEIKYAKLNNKNLPKGFEEVLYKKLISCEVATHHLFLSTKDIEKLGLKANVNPPLRPPNEVNKLWKMLSKVDCIVSDHAPHTLEEKEKGACGFIGVQTLLPLMLDAVLQKRISLNLAVNLLTIKPAQVFNIYSKGKIAAGYDADFVVFDPNASWTIKESDLASKTKWSPYLGRTLKGKIIGTIIRGTLAYWEDKILIKPGYGKPLQRIKTTQNSIPLFLKKHSKEVYGFF